LKILLIEDDPATSAYVAAALRRQGHEVDCPETGTAGLPLATAGGYHVMVIDRMLPGVDGLTIVKKARKAGNRAPVLLLTTLDGIDARVEGLEAGADDYLTKPFALAELLARVSALGRRQPFSEGETVLRVGDLELDRLERTVKRAGRPIELQPQEFRLLEYLMRHAGQTVTRAMLLENVWDFHFDPHTTIVETHISRLRAKIDRDFDDDLIRTVRGAGYCVDVPR
jgi:two-component system OmpR family response regulator